MMSPQDFMMYATPLVVLIAHLISEELARSRAAKLEEQSRQSAVVAAKQSALQTMQVVAEVQSSSAKNVEDSAALTVAKLEEPGGKMDVIHGLTNGTLTAANAKIAALQAELDALKNATP